MYTLTYSVKRLLRLLANSYSFAVLVLFFCVADQALGHAGLLPASPTLLCLLLLSPFGIHLFISHCVDTRTPGPLSVIAGNATVLGPLALIALCALALSMLPGTHWDEGGKWVFLIPYGACIVCVATLAGQHTITSSVLRGSILCSLVLMAYSVWYDTAHPGTFAPITNRAAGFAGNANFAALVAVLLCAAGLHFGDAPCPLQHNRPIVWSHNRFLSLHRKWPAPAIVLINSLLLLVTFAIICMTMSRSGIINFAVLVALFLFYRLCRSDLSPQHRSLELLLLVVATLAALSFLVAFSHLSSSTQGNSRLTRLLNNQRVDDGSAGTRMDALREGLNLIEASPLVGHGTGFARTMSELPHNIYIQQWVNNGLVGLLLYVGLIITAFFTFIHRRSRNGIALIVVTAVGGIFSHNILDQRPFLILLGLLLGISARDSSQNAGSS
jgi:O-antigen ligase